jgi:tetraprenyl-beta-curcumene synthase
MSRPAAIAAAARGRVRAPRGASAETRLGPAVASLDRRLAARAGLALALVNVRYWSRVAPLAREELERWRRRARAIDDSVLRALALAKLEQEGLNAQAAAMLATIAPRAHRRRAVQAIVAAEVLYDYLDGLTESPAHETPGDGERLFMSFVDAVTPSATPTGDYYRHHSCSEDVYLQELVASVRLALTGMPGMASVAEALRRSAVRGAEAQLQIHAAPSGASEDLRVWAEAHAADTPLEWREYLAGAAGSVLAVHALIAAASDRRTTYERALEIDRIYLLISVLPTILDSIVDHAQDTRSGRTGYIQHYGDRRLLARRLSSVIDDAVGRAREAPHGAHHVMTLVGVVAYYLSAPAAGGELAQPIAEHIGAQLHPLLAPALGMMRAWRAARRVRTHWLTRSAARVRRRR